MWHYHDDDVIGPDAAVNLIIEHLPLAAGKVQMVQYRIDAERSNAFNAWKRMGSPATPSAQQIAQLQKAGQLETLGKREKFSINGASTNVELTLPRQAVALMVFEW
jgi:xylan 1,4-beta-xylosidase